MTEANIFVEVKLDGNRLVIPGEVIHRVGLMAATVGDLSDPGMVVKMIHE